MNDSESWLLRTFKDVGLKETGAFFLSSREMKNTDATSCPYNINTVKMTLYHESHKSAETEHYTEAVYVHCM